MMRCTFLSTSSNETTKYAESLSSCTGANVSIIRYDLPDVAETDLYLQVRQSKPDLIVYIGSRWGPQPSIAFLCKANEKIAPSVHLCSDAADPPWHDLLRDYDRAGAFSVQVTIDGNPQWPGAQRGLTLLTPIASAHFPQVVLPHVSRPIGCSYAGNKGSEGGVRRQVLVELMFENLLTIRTRDGADDSYEAYAEHLARSRLTLNVPLSGTEQTMQVKGRVVEAGIAGAALLEMAGAPTTQWFRSGIDFMEYATLDDAKKLIRQFVNEPELTQLMGEQLRQRVLTEHSPQVFWGKIMDRIGLKRAA